MGAQPNDFRYFLTLDNVRKEIIFAPDGWDKDTVVSYKRSEDYFGMIRSLALPLQFVLDGATTLREAFYKYGIEAEVRIEVEQLNKLNWQYNQFFKGDIDFSKFEDSEDHVSVTLMESGATRDIKAFEAVKYEYALLGNDVVNMKLPGVGYSDFGGSIFDLTDGTAHRRNYIPGSTLVTPPSVSTEISNKTVDVRDTNGNEFNTLDNWFVKCIKERSGVGMPVTLRIQGNVSGEIRSPGRNIDFWIAIYNSNNVKIADIYKVNSYRGDLLNFDGLFDFSYTLPFDEKLFVFASSSEDRFDAGIVTTGGALNVSYSSVSEESNCKGISAFNLYKRIMGRISPGTSVESFSLKNTWKNLIFTCGDGIREIPTAKIKTTFKDFFKTFNGLQDSAFGLENKTSRLEEGAYFARDIQIADLGSVKDFKLTPAESFIFNSVKIGYDDGNTDNTDGREEYNSGQVWAMPITRIQKQQDWVSSSRADQFGIEKLRLDYNVTKTTANSDTSSDNDVFMLDCILDGENYRPILGVTYSKIDGLSSGPTAYNLNLTPKKNLIRHGGYLKSMLDKLDTRYINFGSGDKNTALLTIKNGIRVKEDENLPVSSLTGKYFLPYTATFTAKLPVNAMWLIDNMPFGYIAFTWNNVKLKGYILEVSVDIAKNTEQEFKLLLTNDNDLPNLV